MELLCSRQWRRLNRAQGTRAPHCYKWLGTGGTVSRRTANKKLTKLYCPSPKRSPKRLIVLVQPKKWRGATKMFYVCPHFQICSGGTGSRPNEWRLEYA